VVANIVSFGRHEAANIVGFGRGIGLSRRVNLCIDVRRLLTLNLIFQGFRYFSDQYLAGVMVKVLVEIELTILLYLVYRSYVVHQTNLNSVLFHMQLPDLRLLFQWLPYRNLHL
jgi:hypothetical protein